MEDWEGRAEISGEECGTPTRTPSFDDGRATVDSSDLESHVQVVTASLMKMVMAAMLGEENSTTGGH